MFKGILTLEDGSRNKVRKSYVLKGPTHAEASTQLDAITNALVDVTGMSLTNRNLQENTTVAYVNNSTSKVEKGGVTASSPAGKKYPFIIPAPVDALFGAPGTPAFDIMVANPVGPTQVYLTALADNTIISDGETVASLAFVAGKRIE